MHYVDITNENYLKHGFMSIFEKMDGLLSDNKEKFAQYFTTIKVAEYMASMFKTPRKKTIRIIDPGCGVGILTAAFLQKILLTEDVKVEKVAITMYEIDTSIIQTLKCNMKLISQECKKKGIEIVYEIYNENFITSFLSIEDFTGRQKYDYAIINPPYMKLPLDSEDNMRLEELDIKVPNYYAAFIALTKRLLINKGELVAITPRSFCNGAYFLDFRKDLIRDTKFDKIHLFESRKDLFKEDDVLQENIIYHCVKSIPKPNDKVLIKYSYNDSLEEIKVIERNFQDVIFPSDENLTIRILKDDEESDVTQKINSLPCRLEDLNIEVSTGPIVDFREKRELLHKTYVEHAVPLFLGEHTSSDGLKWPKVDVKKYNYIIYDDSNASKMRRIGNYVLVKRMTSKEEKKRIVSALCEESKYNYGYLAFDNKLNYYHRNKEGLPLFIAMGIAIFLNSTIVDIYFRTFSGNTQVNATDLRQLRYPTEHQLYLLGEKYSYIYGNQKIIDEVVEKTLFNKYVK